MSTQRPNTLFWVIAVLALLWNIMGAGAYLADVYADEAMLNTMYSPEQLAYVKAMPAWLTALYAISTWGGLIAAICMLFRKKIATILFLISTLSVLIMTVYGLIATQHYEVFGMFQSVIFPTVIIVIGFFLYAFCKSSKLKSWLR